MAPRNVLLITLDQFRGDSMSCAGHPLVRPPHLDRLAAEGVRLARHYSQCAPCAPGRASLYTGMYQFNHRVVANGTPLDNRFDNIARAMRRGGFEPALFAYTDTGIDPREIDDPTDPRLSTYEGTLPGFDHVLPLSESADAWVDWLAGQGVDVSEGSLSLLAREHERPAEQSISTFLTDRLIDWIDQQDGPWFAHASHLRPHPPYSAAGEYCTMYDPADVPAPIAPVPVDERHPFHRRATEWFWTSAPEDPAVVAYIRAQYLGMISEVDAQLGRLWTALEERGLWDDTLIVLTADHAEQAGDHALLGKVGFFEESYHIVGIVRDPSRPATHGTVVDAFTENVDIMPTMLELVGLEVPPQCDGRSLVPFLDGTPPDHWRTAAHYEFDWRDLAIRSGREGRVLDRYHLAVTRHDDAAYVQFADGTWLAVDLAADPTWRTTFTDPERVLPLAQEMLTWRSHHTDHTMTGFLLVDGGIGRKPPGVRWG